MVFSNEDKVIILNNFEEWGWSAYRIVKEHHKKNWDKRSVQRLINRYKESGTVERKTGSGRPKTATTVENGELVEELICSQEGEPAYHAISYKNILKKNCYQKFDKVTKTNNWIFIQDGAPSHRSNLMQSFLTEKLKNHFVKATEWPPSSPDCNPLDYFFWDKIKLKVYEGLLNTSFQNEEELINRIKKVWKEEASDVGNIRKAIKQFVKRLRAVEEKEGQSIKMLYS